MLAGAPDQASHARRPEKLAMHKHTRDQILALWTHYLPSIRGSYVLRSVQSIPPVHQDFSMRSPLPPCMYACGEEPAGGARTWTVRAHSVRARPEAPKKDGAQNATQRHVCMHASLHAGPLR